MLKRGYVGIYDKMSPEHAHWNALGSPPDARIFGRLKP